MMIKLKKLGNHFLKVTSAVRDIVKKTINKNSKKTKKSGKTSSSSKRVGAARPKPKSILRAMVKAGRRAKPKSAAHASMNKKIHGRMVKPKPKKTSKQAVGSKHNSALSKKALNTVRKKPVAQKRLKSEAKSSKLQIQGSKLKPKNEKPAKQVKELSTIIGAGTKNEKKVSLDWIVGLMKDLRLRRKLVEVGGEETIEVIKGLTKYSMDDDISKNFSIKISDVRAVLNKLHTIGIVKYVKTKDSKTSWFVYNWYIDLDNLQLLSKKVKEEAAALAMASKNQYDYYFCPSCMTDEFGLDDSYQMNFRCPICSTMLQPIAEKGKILKDLEAVKTNKNGTVVKEEKH